MLSDILIDHEERQQNFITQYCKPIKFLGRGAFSQVIEALNKMTGKRVAIKIIEKSQFTSQQILVLRKEAQLLSELNHPNIVRVTFVSHYYMQSKETKNKLYIMMDLIQGVTLEEYMKQKYTEDQIKKITIELLNAIAYLHSKDIIHRDIKPENIMISEDQHVTLIDFGLSAQVNYLDGTGILNDNCGTILYMAPEMIQKKSYNRSVDIWAFGIVVFNLLTQGKHPFIIGSEEKFNYSETIHWMKWNWHTDLNDKAMNFLISTIAYFPENRLTVNQCLEHPWLTGKDSDEPFTFIEILKTHSLFSKIKLLIQAIEFLHFIKRHSQPMYFSTPIDNVVTVRIPRQQQINSKSYEKRKNGSTGESGSLGSNRVSQFKVTTTINTKRQRNSCDQIKRAQDAPKPQFLFPTRYHKSLDKSLKSLHSTVNTTVDNSFNQSISKIVPEQNKQVLQQLKKTAQYQRTQNLQQELISSLRVRSSKPPLIKKTQLE